MSKKLLSIASGILIAVLAFSNAFAGTIKLSGVTFSLGSLIAQGTVSSWGNSTGTLLLNASGIPAITCVNAGGNQVPGQSYPKVSAQGATTLSPNNTQNHPPFYVETGALPQLTWQQAGCPNSNWTAQITFVFWTNATISIYDTSNPPNLLFKQNYVCTTTYSPNSVSCTPAP